MRDLRTEGLRQLRAEAREAAHLVNDGKVEEARRIPAFAQYERGVAADLPVNATFAAAYLAGLAEG